MNIGWGEGGWYDNVNHTVQYRGYSTQTMNNLVSGLSITKLVI